MATIKPGWKLPVARVPTCIQCGEPIKPVAYCDADGWALGGWDCENLCGSVDDDGDSFEWPFGDEDSAKASELESIGFVTV